MKKKQQSEIKNKKEMQIPLETAQELNSTLLKNASPAEKHFFSLFTKLIYFSMLVVHMRNTMAHFPPFYKLLLLFLSSNLLTGMRGFIFSLPATSC